jgi:hypothetical protein
MKVVSLRYDDLKSIINKVINESMYARRRGTKIESFLEDALEFFDPLDYEDEYEYIDQVIQAITDDLLSEDENLEYDSLDYHEMFDELSYYLTKKLYNKIQDHYDKVRTDY